MSASLLRIAAATAWLFAFVACSAPTSVQTPEATFTVGPSLTTIPTRVSADDPTPTWTRLSTQTATPTAAHSRTLTPSRTGTRTLTPAHTLTRTRTPTWAPTHTPTRTPTSTPSLTPTRPPTPTLASTLTPPSPESVCGAAKTPMPTPTGAATAGPQRTLAPSPATMPSFGRSQLLDTSFYSELMGQQMPVLVYLPPGYFDSNRRYPVLYMLSGFAGDHHEWVNWGLCESLETLIRSGQIQPMIVVMPQGDHSWWFNHAALQGSDGKPWGDYIWKDVVGYVDATYRTLARRESRGVGGLSAGGQGALMLALTHPELFSFAGAHSPSIRGADGSLAFFGTPDYFRQYDPLWLFQNTDNWRDLQLWIDVGSGDKQWGDAVHQLHNLLLARGIPHEWCDTWPGIHDNYYWSAHNDDYLVWYSAQMAAE